MIREINTVFKRKWKFRVAVLYPSVYRVAITSLSFHMLYFLLNSFDEVFAERFVLSRLRGEEIAPVSLETRTPLRGFDLIFVSVHSELDYVNIVRMLISAEIPVEREKRRKGPIVIVGGPAPMSNPAPLSRIADFVSIGEIEKVVPEVMDIFLEIGDIEKAKEEISRKEGIYLEGNKKVKRVYVKDLDSQAFQPIVQIQSLDQTGIFGRCFMIEESRGCPYRCAFCPVSRVFHPFRFRSKEVIEELIERGIRANKVRKVVFYSSSFFSNPEAEEILRFTVEKLKMENLSGSF